MISPHTNENDALPSEKVACKHLEFNTTTDVHDPLKKFLDPNNNDIDTDTEASTKDNIPVTKIAKTIMSSNESRESSECSNTPTNFQTKAKELFTSFSRSFGGSLNALPSGVPQISSKVDSIVDQLSLLSEDTSKGFNLSNFIVAGILRNLKSLGVEDIDCKEHVESWLSQRRQRRWKQSLGLKAFNLFKNESPDSSSCIQDLQSLLGVHSSATEISCSINKETSETLTVFSPSQPNSSLMRLTGDGNVKMGQFLGKIEEMRGNFNNATCTILQSTIVLTLPYMKLLSGDQLDNACCQTFTNHWIHIISLLAQNLKSETRKDVNIMLCREFRTLRVESFKLYKRLTKLYRKLDTLFSEIERDIEPALARLQPKKLPAFRGRRPDENSGKPTEPVVKIPINTTLQEKIPPAPIIPKLQLPPVPLSRANTTTQDLFKQHVFFSKSKNGNLLYKVDIEDSWRKFSEISFNSRRELFLHVIDDLHWTLKQAFSISGHVKELFIEGYPECVAGKIQENLKYLKEVSKDNDLLVVSKVTISNQVKSFRGSLSRLVKTLSVITDISKTFFKHIKPSPNISAGATALWKMKSANRFKTTERSSFKTKDNLSSNRENHCVRFDNSGIQLLVPFPNSMNPFIDQCFATSME